MGSTSTPPDDGGDSDDDDSFLAELARSAPREPQPVLPVGATVGPYAIRGLLGRGGMGVVYRAVDARLGRELALKLLPGDIATSDRQKRLRREARSAAAAHHPNVATVFDVGEADGHVYLAMELVAGTTLRARIKAGPLALEEAARIAREIALGLAHAHAKGIVHRDLKPENVMLTPDGGVKVLDFGLAKLHAAELSGSDDGVGGEIETLDGTVMGTPGYMAPEQASGRRQAADPRADVYALGIVLHEMVTGKRPGILESPGKIGDDRLAAIVLRCVASSPEDRWTDAGDVALALEARSMATRAPARLARLSLVATGALLSGLLVFAVARGNRAPVLVPGHEAPAAPPAPTLFFGAIEPVTPSPEALVEYRRAVSDLRDGMRNPQPGLLRATKLDPDFAAAYLRRSLSSWQPASTHFFNEAVRTRSRLDARDLEILSAEEPLEVSTPPDLDEGERRYRALLEKRPGDTEVLLRLGWIAYWRHDETAMASTHDQLTAVDPTMAAAEASMGYFARESNELDAAQQHYEACIERWPGATACLLGLGRTRAELGQCADYFSLTRRAAVLAPDDWFVRVRLLEAMLVTGRSEMEVRAEVQVDTELFESLSKHLVVHADLERALWFGSFEDADAALERSQTIMRATTGWSGLTFVSARLAVAEERGDEAATVAILKRYVGHRAARPPALADAFVLPALLEHHVLPMADVAKLRDAWRTEAEASADWQPWQAAVDFESVLATTPQEATAALSHLDSASLPAVIGPAEGLILGRLLLLAGRAAEARDRLRKAAGACSFMDSGGAETQSAALVRASFELGRASEAAHDDPGACAAYQRVLDRWGHATPRSITADRARAARARLHCAPSSAR